MVEHPIHIKESLGMIRGKNDKVDAQRIALYAYKNREEVRLWTPKREAIQQLDRLTATRSRDRKTGASALPATLGGLRCPSRALTAECIG